MNKIREYIEKMETSLRNDELDQCILLCEEMNGYIEKKTFKEEEKEELQELIKKNKIIIKQIEEQMGTLKNFRLQQNKSKQAYDLYNQ